MTFASVPLRMRLAANLSWVCPVITVIIFVLLIFSSENVPRKTIALVASGALGLIAVGLILGIIALLGISNHGTKGILAPAVVGIIINGLLLSLVVANFMTARFRAKEQHGGVETRGVAAMCSRQWATFRGFPPTGRRLMWRDMVTSRFDNGVIAAIIGPDAGASLIMRQLIATQEKIGTT